MVYLYVCPCLYPHGGEGGGGGMPASEEIRDAYECCPSGVPLGGGGVLIISHIHGNIISSV